MVKQLSFYFDEFFSKFLSYFRRNHSYETVLIRLVEDIKQHLDEGKVVCLLQTDLSHAFDCIPFNFFVSKLHACGFSIPPCELIFNYYYGRKQRVKLGDNVSEWQNVFKGSAQGSIIGPISYNMFTNDMFMVVSSASPVYRATYTESQRTLRKGSL